MFFIKKLFLFWKTNTTLCSFFNAKEEALLHSSVNVSLLLINEISHNESLINYLLLLFKIHVYNWKKKNQLNITNKCSAKNKLKWVKCLEFSWLKLNAFKVCDTPFKNLPLWGFKCIYCMFWYLEFWASIVWLMLFIKTYLCSEVKFVGHGW